MGNCKRDRRQAQLALELLDHVGRVGPGAVHLVDERDSRNRVPLHLAVDGDRLRLHAGHGAEHQHGAVEHPERPLHLDGEINVPGRVDDVDLRVVPVDRRRGRGDRDPSLLLQLHVVHHGTLTLDFLDHVGAARVIQDPLGERGLARVDVGRDADVAIRCEGFPWSRCTLTLPPKGGTPLAGATSYKSTSLAGFESARRSRTSRRGHAGKIARAHQNRPLADISRFWCDACEDPV